MKFAKHIILIFSLAFILSYAPCIVQAQTDMLSVFCDIENSTVSITYTERLHSYAQVAVVITGNDDNSIVYLNQLSTDEGHIELKNVPIKKDGTYTVAITALYSGETLYEEFDFYSPDTLRRLWQTATSQRDCEVLKSEWNKIESAFKLDIKNLQFLKDRDLFFKRLAESRDNYDLSDDYIKDREKFSDVCEEIALFAAIDHTEDEELLTVLVNESLEYIAREDKDFYSELSMLKEVETYSATMQIFKSDKKEIKDVKDLIDELKQAIEKNKVNKVLENIKNVEHIDEITTILTDDENVKLLGIEKLVKKYIELKSKTSVNKTLFSGDFETRDEFVKLFEKAIDKANSPDDKDKNGGTSSDTKGSSSSAPTASVRVSDEVKSFNFTDLENHLWAKDSIAKLYNKGIISGRSESIFAPADFITREEFVKMAVLSFGVATSDESSGFSDVTFDAWYAPFVTGAKNAGLVSGIGNGLFGVGRNITRQDIAVIFVNYLSSKGIDISLDMSLVTAEDFENTADYAKESVAFLVNNGILKGNEKGLICPLDYATRAEISVMLVRFNNKFVSREG
ncbi:MAG: S-layer homology domain-containing protein [Clostridia bacterium]|nr:S-layer homology domain-containing protein [Clostridia bacterium]